MFKTVDKGSTFSLQQSCVQPYKLLLQCLLVLRSNAHTLYNMQPKEREKEALLLRSISLNLQNKIRCPIAMVHRHKTGLFCKAIRNTTPKQIVIVITHQLTA